MSEKINRKVFLKQLGLVSLATSATILDPCEVFAQQTNDQDCNLVAVMGGEPAEMFQKGIEAFGGIQRFVKKGQKVTIKPNVAWDKEPEFSANTNPELIAALIKACQEAGASEITVFDNTCDNWRKCYEHSGIEQIVKSLGADMIPGNSERDYREVSLPKAKSLKTAKIHQAILDCDVWFNVPVLKTHGGACLSNAMKNLMGIVWDRGFFHQNDLHQCIADICTLEKPAALNIVDAYRVLKSNGPRGRDLSDVVQPKGLLLSPDIVAIDTASVKFFNQIQEMSLDAVPYISKAQELGVGTMDLEQTSVRRIKI